MIEKTNKKNNAKWHMSRYPNVRYRIHPTRKCGINFDRYFVVRYQSNGKRQEIALGWSSRGWTAQKANAALSGLRMDSYNEENKWPAGLKTAEQLSEALQGAIKPERLLQLAESGFCPHYKIEAKEPMFKSLETRAWLAKNILTHNEGQGLPITINVAVKNKIESLVQPPKSIRFNKDIIPINAILYPPGVYFLCLGKDVVYVGQSLNVLGRLSSHIKEKNFDRVYLLPVPKQELDSVEGALIRLLKPPLNQRSKNGHILGPTQRDDTTDENVSIKYGFCN